LRNSSSEYGVFTFDWDLDGFVGNVCGIFSWHEVCPMEVDVMLSSVDKGSKEVEVVSHCVHVDKDDTVFSAQGEDGGGGEAITIEVGVLVHLSVVGAVMFLAVEGMYECMGIGDVDALSRFEFMIPKSAEDVLVSVDECPEAGRGHDGVWSSGARVLILIGCLLKSASSSGAWRSSELTHKS